MSRKKDMLNQKFGMLLVIDEAPSDKKGNAMWKCQCDCGNICIIAGKNLRNGNSKSCGCLSKKFLIEYNHTRKKDLTNQRFGKLVALEEIGSNNQKNLIWKCQCDCGNFTEVASGDLISGNTRSCGCNKFRSYGEQKIEQILKENNIEFKKQFTFADLVFDSGVKARYDFYLPKYNLLIEYDGIQHSVQGNGYFDNKNKIKITKEHDRIKNEYAIKNNIKLNRISYLDYDNINLNMILRGGL